MHCYLWADSDDSDLEQPAATEETQSADTPEGDHPAAMETQPAATPERDHPAAMEETQPSATPEGDHPAAMEETQPPSPKKRAMGEDLERHTKKAKKAPKKPKKAPKEASEDEDSDGEDSEGEDDLMDTTFNEQAMNALRDQVDTTAKVPEATSANVLAIRSIKPLSEAFEVLQQKSARRSTFAGFITATNKKSNNLADIVAKANNAESHKTLSLAVDDRRGGNKAVIISMDLFKASNGGQIALSGKSLRLAWISAKKSTKEKGFVSMVCGASVKDSRLIFTAYFVVMKAGGRHAAGNLSDMSVRGGEKGLRRVEVSREITFDDTVGQITDAFLGNQGEPVNMHISTNDQLGLAAELACEIRLEAERIKGPWKPSRSPKMADTVMAIAAETYPDEVAQFRKCAAVFSSCLNHLALAQKCSEDMMDELKDMTPPSYLRLNELVRANRRQHDSPFEAGQFNGSGIIFNAQPEDSRNQTFMWSSVRGMERAFLEVNERQDLEQQAKMEALEKHNSTMQIKAGIQAAAVKKLQFDIERTKSKASNSSNDFLKQSYEGMVKKKETELRAATDEMNRLAEERDTKAKELEAAQSQLENIHARTIETTNAHQLKVEKLQAENRELQEAFEDQLKAPPSDHDVTALALEAIRKQADRALAHKDPRKKKSEDPRDYKLRALEGKIKKLEHFAQHVKNMD